MNHDNEGLAAGQQSTDCMADAMIDFMTVLELLFQFVFEDAGGSYENERQTEIKAKFGAIQVALAAGLHSEAVVHMLLLTMYEMCDLLKLRRAKRHQPEINFKSKLKTFRAAKPKAAPHFRRV